MSTLVALALALPAAIQERPAAAPYVHSVCDLSQEFSF
jgi:hypothetical protein